MDAFWIIPLGIIGLAFVGALVWHLAKQPETPSNPRVLVDKPPSEPTVDKSAEGRDWVRRPYGSYVEWRRDTGK